MLSCMYGHVRTESALNTILLTGRYARAAAALSKSPRVSPGPTSVQLLMATNVSVQSGSGVVITQAIQVHTASPQPLLDTLWISWSTTVQDSPDLQYMYMHARLKYHIAVNMNNSCLQLGYARVYNSYWNVSTSPARYGQAHTKQRHLRSLNTSS